MIGKNIKTVSVIQHLFLLLTVVLIPFIINAQNVGIGVSAPHPSAKLEINSTSSGLLIPRLTTAQRNSIVNPAHSLLIFNIDNFCIEAYNDTLNVWLPVSCPVQCNPCDTCVFPIIDSLKASLYNICSGDSVFVYTFASNYDFITVNTSSDYAIINQGDTSLLIVGQPNSVIVGVCNSCGCTTDSIAFRSGSAPTVTSITSNSPLCPLDTIYITASTNRQATYMWTVPSGVTSINGFNKDTLIAILSDPTSGGVFNFNLRVCNGCGCTDTSITVNVVNPSINLVLSGQTQGCQNDTVVIYASVSGSVGSYTTSWNVAPSGLTVLYQDNDSLKLYLSSQGSFSIIGRSCDSCGCDYDTIVINVSNCFRCLTVDAGGNDYGEGIIQTSDGNYVIVGYTNGIGAGNDDIYLAKISPSGNILWSTTIGGTGNDRGWDVIETRDGGLAIMATTTSYGAGSTDMYVIKTDANGNVLWTRTIGGGGNDVKEGSIIELPGGNLIVGGSEWSAGFGAGNTDVYIAKLDASGNVIWTIAGGSGNGDFASFLTLLKNSDKVIGVGETQIDGNVDKAYIVQVDTLGNLATAYRIGGGNPDVGREVVEYPTGRIALGGYSATYGPGNRDVYVVKINAVTNNIVWTSAIGGANRDEGHAIVGYRNSYIVGGFTNSFGQGGWDMYFVAVDTLNGDILWTKTIGNTGNEQVKDMIIDANGYLVAIGNTNSFNANTDIYIVRLRPDGTFTCTTQCLGTSGGSKAVGGNKTNGPSTFNSGGSFNTGGNNTGSGGTITNQCP